MTISKQKTLHETLVRVGLSNALAVEHLDRLSEIYHGLELVTALRETFPGARVYLSIGNDEAELTYARQFEGLKAVQATGMQMSPLAEWVGHRYRMPELAGPAGIQVLQDVNRVTDAQVALDVGGAYGRLLSSLAVVRLSGQAEPAFVSSDCALSDAGKKKPWKRVNGMESAPVNPKAMKRARKQDKDTAYDPEWLGYWFGSTPSRDEWLEYQAGLRARAMEMGPATVELRRAASFAVDRKQLTSNSVAIADSPFLPYYRAISREMKPALSAGAMEKAQLAQLATWVRNYDTREVDVQKVKAPGATPAGSRERALASFLGAEVQLRERVTDYLIREQYQGELGNVVRGMQCEEEEIAAKIKSGRRVALTVGILGAAVGAGSAAMTVSMAQTGNLVAAQQAQASIQAMNNNMTSTVTATVAALMAAEQGLAQRSRSMSAGMAEVIGPIEVELAGQTMSLTAGSVDELRSKLRELYVARFP